MEPFKYINPNDHPLCTFKENHHDGDLTYYFENDGDQNCCWGKELEGMMAIFDAAGIPYTLTALVPHPEDYDDYSIRNHPSLSAAERNPTLR
jgi:hypothetical protein